MVVFRGAAFLVAVVVVAADLAATVLPTRLGTVGLTRTMVSS